LDGRAADAAVREACVGRGHDGGHGVKRIWTAPAGILLLLLGGCSGIGTKHGIDGTPTNPDDGSVAVTVPPATVTIRAGATEAFAASVRGTTKTNVTWSVNAVAGNSLASQLKQVAQVIAVRSALGIGRQIFFCSQGGFDTHSDQLDTQVGLYGQLSAAMAAFYSATQELSVANQVTTFTLSEFSRTFQPRSNGGTDHPWGGHQVMMGGAVQGNALYGTFPTLALGGPEDVGNNGRWVPTTSVDQYAATLASWFGVSNTDLPAIFPNLVNFQTANLGFMTS